MTQYFAVAVAVSVIVASPYLLHIGAQFGFGKMLEAIRGQGSELAYPVASTVVPLVPLNWGVPAWNILALSGLSYSILSRRRFRGLWAVFLAWVPSEGSWLASLPVALLAGLGARGINTIPVPALEKLTSRWSVRWAWTAVRLVLVVCCGAYAVVLAPSRVLLPASVARDPFSEASHVTGGEARFLASLGSSTSDDTTILMVGNENDWAPLLSGRTILNVWFGTEWEPGKGRAVRELAVAITASHTAGDLYGVIQLASARCPLCLRVPDLVDSSKADRRPRNNPVTEV